MPGPFSIDTCLPAFAGLACSVGGTWFSCRTAGKIAPRHQLHRGFVIILATSVVNVGCNALWAPHAAWALLPVAVSSFGWALMVPAVTLRALALAPDRRGMALPVPARVLHRGHPEQPA
jgi:DHA1 family bicyclomycin/chloramphenicol resistance-like MFS transporter